MNICTLQVEHWGVPDLDRAPTDEGLPLLEREVRALVERLRGG